MLLKINTIFKNKNSRNVLVLYLSLFIGLIVSLAASSINTHALGADQFGDFKFLQTISTFSITVTTFGFFVSAGRLLALNESAKERREILGSVIVIALCIYVIFALVFWILSYYIVDVFDRELGWLIRLSLPLIFIYPLNICLENVLKGLNSIYSLASIRFFPNFFYLIYAYSLYQTQMLDLATAYFAYIGFSAIVFLSVLCLHQPLFHNIKVNIRLIYNQTRDYGFKVYTGILASVATMHFGGVMTAFYLDTKSAGFFLLARTMTLPLIQISTAIGTSFFRKFANSKVITTKVIAATMGSSLLLLAAFLIVTADLVKWLYPPEFEVIISLCYIMSVGATLQGIGGMINNFVCARGFGGYSRNASFIRGAINILGYTLGIKYFGMHGAAYTVLISGCAYLLAMSLCYKLIIRKTDI
ncbi:hypothetical protein MNBD_GAMMA09-3277 [hydrothermal vent metagenome]|uniref:Polysaccharide biosynthesis protein C-terminal domain-containing protein n=1 Tax=hydrothermal vent metagenome TaxID=652676 RepID=A0A3B0XRC5_9ZZZZ